MTDRHCKATNKKGQPCQSTSLIGDYCFAHQPKEVRDKHGFGGSQPGAGQPRKPRVTEVLRQWVEDHVAEILEPYTLGLRATTTVTGVDEDGEPVSVEVPNIVLRQASADRLLDRTCGKPAQSVELSGADGGPVRIVVPRDEERARRVAGILGKTGSIGHEGRQRREPSNGAVNGEHRNGS